MEEKTEKRGFYGQDLTAGFRDKLHAFHAGERGEVVALGRGSLFAKVLDRALDDSFAHLKYLDEYGDTVFNHLQMEAVIPELHRLRPHAQTPEERAVLEDVIAMAEKVRQEVHSYLTFIGD